MNKLLTKTLLALGLTFTGLAAAQTPLAFASVAHVTSGLSTALNDTWATLGERGYSGSVASMTDSSVTYIFEQGERKLEVSLRQTDNGVIIMTREPNSLLLVSN